MIKHRDKGTHTWDIFVRYHRCPQCGVIQEDRQDYTVKGRQYVKELHCSACGHRFVDVRHNNPQSQKIDKE